MIILIWAAGQDDWNQFGKVGKVSTFFGSDGSGQDNARMVRIVMNQRIILQDDPRMIPG